MKQFLVIGLGRFGLSVAQTLVDNGHEVLGVDEEEDLVELAAERITHAVQADATEKRALLSLGAKNFDVAVIGIGQDLEASILCTMIAKEVGIPYVVAKAQNHLHGRVLEKTGADRVVFPERDMGVRVANNLVSTNILDYIELSKDYRIMEIKAPEFTHGKTLSQLKLPNKYGVNIIAIKKGPEDINVAPSAEDIIDHGDILVTVGTNSQLLKLGRTDA